MSDTSAVIRTSSVIKSPHGFSTRRGGVSTGIFNSLNLGMNRGDDSNLVKENWRRFLEACNIHEEEFVCGKQVHGNYVHVATRDIARPAYGPGWMADADGYVTNERGLPLAVFTADCVPVLLEDIEDAEEDVRDEGPAALLADVSNSALSDRVQRTAVLLATFIRRYESDKRLVDITKEIANMKLEMSKPKIVDNSQQKDMVLEMIKENQKNQIELFSQDKVTSNKPWIIYPKKN